MRILLCVLALFAVTLASAQEEYKRGFELYKQGKYKEAITAFDEAIASNPNWYYPIILRGKCNLKLKNYKDALQNFNDAMTLEVPSKEIPMVKYDIARSYMGMSDYPKAIHALEELFTQVPKDRLFDLYMNRGQCEMQIAKSAEDSRDNKKAADNYSKAVVSFSEALKNASQNDRELEIEAAFQKAFAQYKIGNFEGGIQSIEKSIKAFQEVLVRNQKEERAHKFLVELSFRAAEKVGDAQKAAKYGEAVVVIERYLSLWPNNPEVMIKKGSALQGAKRYKDAIEVFKLVQRLQPNNSSVYFAMGSCLMASQSYKEAIESFKTAQAKGEKANPSLFSYMAYCYQQQKTNCTQNDVPLYEEAVKILERGAKELSGQGKTMIEQDLQRKRENLAILKENMSTDEQNHAATIENVKNLTAAIKTNRQKLQVNQENLLRASTPELKAAVEDGKKAIKRDEDSLAKEFEAIKKYVSEAERCGGAAKYKYYNQLKEALKQQSGK